MGRSKSRGRGWLTTVLCAVGSERVDAHCEIVILGILGQSAEEDLAELQRRHPRALVLPIAPQPRRDDGRHARQEVVWARFARTSSRCPEGLYRRINAPPAASQVVDSRLGW